jgi:hypothetical protein
VYSLEQSLKRLLGSKSDVVTLPVLVSILLSSTLF